MKRIIEVVLFNGVLGLDVSGPLAVFTAATEILMRRKQNGVGYEVRHVTADGEMVRTGDGMRVVPDGVAGRKSSSMLLVPGGIGVEAALGDAALVRGIRNAANRAERVVSVCNGALLLAAAGLLEGRTATTHWMTAQELARENPSVSVQAEALYVRDGNVYTSAGVTTGIDLALSILEEDHGRELAMEVARVLVVYYRRPGWQTQFSPALQAQERAGERFARLADWAAQRLDRALTVEELAEKAGMSPRNFARVFARETGMTPGKYVETLRLDRARELLESGEDGLDHVARTAGFGREERLRRAFRRAFGITPREYRAHFAVQGAHAL